ncbi:MAG: IS1182 family transposase [Magnetococcales bacterium]|nr:IS1182 family transposase [Magnetococcales bacterium]
MRKRFKVVDRKTPMLFPPTVQELLSESHLARFVVEILEQLDLRKFTDAYAGRGKDAYHPEVLIGIFVYGYATGVYSSRAIERGCRESLPFMFIAANTHPDHATISDFRKRFEGQIKDVFTQVLIVAARMGIAKLGTVSLDGSKINANASKHSALSFGHAEELEKRLRVEVEELCRLAEKAESQQLKLELDIPEELKRREERLAAIREAKIEIEARAAERAAREKAEYDARMAKRAAQRREGKTPRGKDPEPPAEGPNSTDQVNLTDPESRIMPVSGGGFEQAYNAQIAVDADSLLIVGCEVVQAVNDKQQLEPMLRELAALPESLGTPHTLLGDSGYFSEANVKACAKAGIEPLLATGREEHYHSLETLQNKAEPLSADADVDPLTRMKHDMKTGEGRKRYGRRKCTVEPVFGIIKQAMGFRQFMRRGLERVRSEWQWVSLAWNIRRMAVLKAAMAV